MRPEVEAMTPQEFLEWRIELYIRRDCWPMHEAKMFAAMELSTFEDGTFEDDEDDDLPGYF